MWKETTIPTQVSFKYVQPPHGRSYVLDDGRVPFGPSKTGKRGRNPFTQAEEDAVLSWLIYDQIYDKVTQTFTDAYRELPKRMRPTGKGYWKQRAGTDALKNRKEDSLRSYFRKHFPQAPRD